MIEVEIQNEEFKKLKFRKLGKKTSESISYDECARIKNISISRIDLVGELCDIEISDLSLLCNLESCIISNYTITDKDLSALNLCLLLKSIQFSKCIFKNENVILKNNITSIVIEACTGFELLQLQQLSNLKKLRIINCKNLDLKEIEKNIELEELYINNCIVTEIKKLKKLNNLKKFSIEESMVDDLTVLEEIPNTVNKSYRKVEKNA